MTQVTSPFEGLSRREKRELLKRRTKQFAVSALQLCAGLPRSASVRVIANQLLRSATSVAANYRATCRARSPKEFIAKLGIVIEECDESLFWLELLDTQTASNAAGSLAREADELLAIFVASRISAERTSASKLLSIGNRQSAIGNHE